MGHNRRDPDCPQFTDHYFTGDYPTPLTDREEAAEESEIARPATVPPRLALRA